MFDKYGREHKPSDVKENARHMVSGEWAVFDMGDGSPMYGRVLMDMGDLITIKIVPTGEILSDDFATINAPRDFVRPPSQADLLMMESKGIVINE